MYTLKVPERNNRWQRSNIQRNNSENFPNLLKNTNLQIKKPNKSQTA